MEQQATTGEGTAYNGAKDVLTVPEAARYLGLSRAYLYKLMMRHAVSYSKPGGKVCYFSRQDLDRYMMSNPYHTKAEIQAQAARAARKGGRR